MSLSLSLSFSLTFLTSLIVSVSVKPPIDLELFINQSYDYHFLLLFFVCIVCKHSMLSGISPTLSKGEKFGEDRVRVKYPMRECAGLARQHPSFTGISAAAG